MNRNAKNSPQKRFATLPSKEENTRAVSWCQNLIAEKNGSDCSYSHGQHTVQSAETTAAPQPDGSEHPVSNAGCHALGPIFIFLRQIAPVLKVTVARLVCRCVTVARKWLQPVSAVPVRVRCSGEHLGVGEQHPRQLRNKERRWDLTLR